MRNNHLIHNALFICCVSVSMVLLVAADAGAASINWQAGAGVFSDPANWRLSDVPPGSADEAYFGAYADGGSYTVTFTEDTVVSNIYVGSAPAKSITFDMGGYKVTAIGLPTTAHAGAIDIRATAGTGAQVLRLTNGLFESLGCLSIGERGTPPDADGAQLIVDANATLESFGSIRVSDRTAQKAVIRVENGGKWNHDIHDGTSAYWTYIGRDFGTHGSIVVDGAGSIVDFKPSAEPTAVYPYIVLGANGTGVIHVVNGGRFINVGALAMTRGNPLGIGNEASGTLHVEGAGSEFISEASINAGIDGQGVLLAENGGLISAAGSIDIADSGSGTAIASNGVITAGTTFYVYADGTLEIDNGTVTAATIARFFSGSTYKLKLHTPDTATLSCDEFRIDASATLELSLSADFQANLGDEFKVCTYSGSLTGVQAFDSLAQDAKIELGGYVFQIEYGDKTTADSVILKVVGLPPGTVFSFF